MGQGKKEAVRKVREGKTGDGMQNVKLKGENFYRDAKKVKKLKMFEDGKAQRNASGKVTKAASYQSRDMPNARIEPNRKWFNNSRVIAQDSLAQFREAVAKQRADPFSVLLKSNKLPMSLIDDNKTKDGVKQHKAKIAVEATPFDVTFGPKAQRKRVKLGVSSLEDLAGESGKMHDDFLDRQEQIKFLSGQLSERAGETADDPNGDGDIASAREPIFSKGQSKRIWNELYKVIDSSDVLIHVLDARDPEGTRCRSVEKYIKEEAPHKHLIFLLNKCDLVPTSIAAAWVRRLSSEYPTLAFHASITNSFGKGSLISILRQFSQLHSNRKQISVGLVGYPNTGKSSIINTLRKKKVCTVAPIPGETKVWQYVTLSKSIFLVDAPGIVPPNTNDTDEDILLRGVVRVENVSNPEQYVAAALRKCQMRHIQRTYDIAPFADATEFLETLARKGGRLLRGGEADLDGVAKMVLNDFLRGKIPWFTPPPKLEGEAELGEGKDGNRVSDMLKLNQQPTADLRAAKRKRDGDDVDGDDFAGFSDSDVDADDDESDRRTLVDDEDDEDEDEEEEEEEEEEAAVAAIEVEVEEEVKAGKEA